MEITIPYTPRKWQRDMHNGLDSHRWAVIVAHRRAGKTVALINQLIKSAVVHRLKEPFFAYVAPQYNQAKSIAWAYLKFFTATIPGFKSNESELWVQLPHNKAKIRLFGMDNPDSLRGLYFDGIVLDEYADMHPDAWESVIRPALSDRRGWACLSGTPKGHNAFYEAYIDSINNPNWFTGVYRADATGVIDPEEMDDLTKDMSGTTYRREYMCDFDIEDEDVLIPFNLVAEAQKRVLPKNNIQPVIVGVDVARFGDDVSVIRGRQGRDARSLPVERYHKADTMKLAALVADYYRRHNGEVCFVDGGGVGGGVVDRLNQLGMNVIEVNFGGGADRGYYARKDAEMWAYMKEWLKGGCIDPTDAKLAVQLTSRRYSFNLNSKMELEPKKRMKERGLKSPDDADSLAVTFAYPVQPPDYAEQTVRYFKEGGFTRSNGFDYDPLGGVR